MTRFARLCIHDEIKEHLVFVPTEKFPARALPFESCPGGEFLPEGALVFEKVNGKWPDDLVEVDSVGWFYCGSGFKDALDALASQVGESGS